MRFAKVLCACYKGFVASLGNMVFMQLNVSQTLLPIQKEGNSFPTFQLLDQVAGNMYYFTRQVNLQVCGSDYRSVNECFYNQPCSNSLESNLDLC